MTTNEIIAYKYLCMLDGKYFKIIIQMIDRLIEENGIMKDKISGLYHYIDKLENCEVE